MNKNGNGGFRVFLVCVRGRQRARGRGDRMLCGFVHAGGVLRVLHVNRGSETVLKNGLMSIGIGLRKLRGLRLQLLIT